MRVLLVEANAASANQCRQLLTALRGVSVVKTATTEADARAWLLGNPGSWELLVVDLFLEQGHGFNVLRACTQRLPTQRAVVLSGYADPIARQHAARAGADGFFDKTSQLDGLLEFCSRHAREVYDSRR